MTVFEMLNCKLVSPTYSGRLRSTLHYRAEVNVKHYKRHAYECISMRLHLNNSFFSIFNFILVNVAPLSDSSILKFCTNHV